MQSLRDVPLLVTGASGFIGGRLAERLAQEDGARVVGVGRTFREEALLTAAGVELARADLRDQGVLARLCEGKQVVFHLAAWLPRSKGGEAEATAINVDLTRALAQAAARAGTQRMVVLSSVAAYGLPPTDEVEESIPIDTAQPSLYGRTKALGEQALREVAAHTGLSIAIIRPAMVYGPRSSGWTAGMLRMVQKGTPVLFGAAEGYAFPVYVDDVVHMTRLAGTCAQAHGEAFNASDAPLTWQAFFAFYAAMCGRPARRLPLPLARWLARANQWFRLGLPLTPELLEMYRRRLRYPTAKAERLLGWQVQMPLAEGMRRSEAWLRQTGQLA